MTELVRGFRGKLGDILDISQPFTVKMHTVGNAVYDTCCFGVDAEGKLSDDRYMVFYNQTSSPAGEITFGESGGVSEYTVSLGGLPPTVAKLVFTVSIDGGGTMGQITSHTISVFQNGAEKARLTLGGGDFSEEKAIIGAEIYLKSVWRIAVVASGFNGGLADLLASYGGEAAEEPAPAPQPAQPAPVRQSIPQPVPQPVQQPRSSFSRSRFRSLFSSRSSFSRSRFRSLFGSRSSFSRSPLRSLFRSRRTTDRLQGRQSCSTVPTRPNLAAGASGSRL